MMNQDIKALQKIEPQDSRPGGGGQLVWIPPGYELAASEPQQNSQNESHLWDYIWLVWRGRWLVAFAFLFCVGIATFMMLRATPLYVAVAKLNIGSQSPQIIEFGESSNRNNGGSGNVIETQMQLLRSRTLARKVMEELKFLAPDAPTEGGAAKTSGNARIADEKSEDGKTGDNKKNDKVESSKPVLASFMSYLVSFVRKPDSQKARMNAKEAADVMTAQRVNAFLSALSVGRIRDTEIVEVRFFGADPALCAHIANAVCDAYMALNYQTQTNSFEYASKWIEQKLYDVKANLEKSEEKLYEVGGKGEEALSFAENADRSSARFEAMNDELAVADRLVNDKLFQLESIKKGTRPDDLGSSSSQASTRINNMRADLEKCEVDYDQALQQFGPEMPQVKILKAAKARLESQIAQERKRSSGSVLANAQFEYDQAKSQSDFLHASFEKQKEQMLATQQRLIKFNILKREVEVNKELYNNLLQRSREVGVTSGLKAGNVSIVEAAERPLFPSYPNKQRTILIGGFLGLFLGIGLVFFREYMDTTIRGAIDVQNYGKMATLGLLPHIESRRSGKDGKTHPETFKAGEPRSAFAENMRHLRTSVQYSLAGHSPKTILVTSAMPSEGKTTVASNLAIALAQSGHRTILVDADLKKPSIHKFFDANRDNGLSDILTGKTDGNLSAHLFKTDIDNLYVLPSGARPPNPVDLLDSVVMHRLLNTLAEHFDHVILDCAPTLDLADTGVLFRHVDGVILVVKPGKTPRASLVRVNEKVQGFGGRILGVVLNNRKTRSSKRYGYGYDYGSKYGDQYDAKAETEELPSIE